MQARHKARLVFASAGHIAEARAAAAQAVAAAPGFYQLWTAALGVPWRWPARAEWLQRALRAVAPAADAGAPKRGLHNETHNLFTFCPLMLQVERLRVRT
jgi:hypothetical protein